MSSSLMSDSSNQVHPEDSTTSTSKSHIGYSVSSKPFESSSSSSFASPQHFYLYNEFTPSATSFRSVSPSYTSQSLSEALSKWMPPSRHTLKNSNLHSEASLFTLCQSFYFSSVAIASLYNSESPAMEIVCAMSEWKETSTTSGLIVRATENNSHLRMLDKFEVLYFLAFASKTFLAKLACVISEAKQEILIAVWVLKFVRAVEKALIDGSLEETYFETGDLKMLEDAYERNMKMTSDSESYQILCLSARPSQIHHHFRPPNYRDREQILSHRYYSCWELKSSVDETRSNDSLSNEDFEICWNRNWW